MKKTILLSSLVAGLALTGCNRSTESSTTADTRTTDTTATAAATTDTMQARANAAGNDLERAANNAGDSLARAGDRAANAMSNMAHDVSAKLNEWRLSATEIEADLAADRPIVRTKSSAGSPTGKIDKSTLQSSVEARIKADSQLANLKLDINADRPGEIQLEGKAQTADQVGRAIALALDTEGVTKVTSKIDLDKDAVKNTR